MHEPKGISTAALGTVYVANGVGSGSWNNVGTSSFTGMIADFTWPVVQSGWLELDGSDINTTTYAALYAVMTIQMSGTRVNASPIITSLSSTANMRVGYYVFGTGIASGTTIVSIDSASQITLSANASSTGTATIVVSPWLLNTGTIRLPDVSTAGRYRRSRSATSAVGQLQVDTYQAHNHTGSVSVTGSTNTVADHTHSNSLTDLGHNHGLQTLKGIANVPGGGTTAAYGPAGSPPGSIFTDTNTTGITLNNAAAGAHAHTVAASGSFTTALTGAGETRPISLVVMTCVKT